MDATPLSDPVPLPVASSNQELIATLRRVAWLSILVGLLIEALVLIVKFGFGSAGGPAAIITDTIGKISWPFLVCFGIASGQVIAKGKASIAQIWTMGISGLLVAPIAFTSVRILHKGMSTALGQADTGAAAALVITLAIVKAAQYGMLAALIGRLQTRPISSAWQHARIGLGIGLVFGSASLLLTQMSAESVTTVNVITQSINELIVPVGCSLILFSTKILSKRLA